ncbi:hypothetical protein C4K07_4411 [Pseudomonas chlororaphis subsp. aureofaciens]|uniref:Uncharacterized protein n=1 Tax=Pseudomonas chlororaphis subsp. aureofaciens TaxID=587851 RepID=A0AAD0ZLG5_9PSED|nr:hypothetical protein C4K07_4411 [Pseudomonas chlororaphis subsp. aureofaciens]
MMSPLNTVDYNSLNDDYWKDAIESGKSNADFRELSRWVAETCGIGSVLDIGCGTGGWFQSSFLWASMQ